MFKEFKIVNIDFATCCCCLRHIESEKTLQDQYRGFQLCSHCTKQLAQFMIEHQREILGM